MISAPEQVLELLRRAAKSRLKPFLHLMWQIVNPGVEFKSNWHIDAICEHLEAVTKRQLKSLVISLPPGCCKSSIVGQAWPCWEWLQFPERRWLFATNALENAKKEAVYRRTIISSDFYKELAPEFELQQAGKRILVTRNDKNGVFRAISTGSSITGDHFDCQVIDDPNDAQRTGIDELALINQWYDEVISTRRRDNMATVLIQQRLAANDLAGHLISLEPDCMIVLPAIYDANRISKPTPLGWKDPRTQTGELLWPARLDEKFLKSQRRILGPIAFKAQYQQDPVSEQGNIFKPAWWLRHASGFEPEKNIQWIVAIDTASSLAKGSDRTVIQVWALGCNGVAYLIEQQSGHWEIVEKVRRIKNMFGAYSKLHICLVEERNEGFALCSLLEPELKEVGGRVWRWRSQANKDSRIRSIVPLVEGGQVSIPEDAEGELLIEEGREFPSGDHDDTIDVCAMVLDCWRNRMYRLGGDEVIEKPKPKLYQNWKDEQNGWRVSKNTTIRVGSSANDSRIRGYKRRRPLERN